MRANRSVASPARRRARPTRIGTVRSARVSPLDAATQPGTAAVDIAAPDLRKRQRNALRNRADILSAARAVFSELGYGAATIRDIVRRTNLAVGTFYNYFPDKESVLREIIEEFTGKVRARVHERRMEAHTLPELLRSSFFTCFSLYAEEQRLVEMMARNAGELSLLTSGTVLEAAVEDLVSDLRVKELEGVLPHLDNQRLARAAVALAAELGLHMLAQKPVDIEGTTEFATQFMLGGMERLNGGSLTDRNPVAGTGRRKKRR